MTELEIKKKALCSDIDRRVEEKILEPTNGDLLKKLINNADDMNEATNIASLGTMYRKTGLYYDVRLEKGRDNNIRYFKKNEKLSFHQDDDKPTHKLIIGDNYDALQNLLIQYKGCIDVIYIDPPYGKDSMGEFAQTNYNNAISRDNLLSMLYPRLLLARDLLNKEGVIFCSIDDRNHAYIKCLFDEVFGEKNYICTFPKKGTGGRQDSTHYAIVHEYLLCYSVSISDYSSNRIELDKKYKFYDEKKGLYYNTQLLRKWGDNSRRQDRPNLYYPIYYSTTLKKLSIDNEENYDVEIYPMLDADNEGCWRWGKTTMQQNMEEGNIEIQLKKGEYIPYERLYCNPDDSSEKLYSSWIDDVDTSTGSKLLKTIVGNGVFKYPKATDYIYKIVQMATSKRDVIVLDFFAGSGTTGHAILDMNKDDNGNRTFILCQQNEVTAEDPNGIALDATTKRLKRIMTGKCYDGYKAFKWNERNEPYGGNLDVYEIASVPEFDTTEGNSAFDVINETLYGKKFDSMEEKIKWVCANFKRTENILKEKE